MKVNQQLLADKLKLSRATVSRCFTNHPGINPSTRAKVFALAARLGYNHLEKKAGVSGERLPAQIDIGVLVCVDSPSFTPGDYAHPGQALLNGLAELSRVFDARLDLNFVNPRDLHLENPSYARIFSRRRQWDGVVLIYPFPRTVVEELQLRYSCVSLVEQYVDTPLNCVDVDHHRGITKLVDHLRSQGHERIGFFTWRYPVEASWSLRRFSAYAERLTALGLPLRHEDIINAGPREPLGVQESHARALQQTREGVTAWICAADHQAYDLLHYLHQHGVRVPADVSVTGFDGIPQPARSPLLSTIQIPYHQIGVTGGRRLIDLLQKRFDPVQHIFLDCELRPGETVGPAPSR